MNKDFSDSRNDPERSQADTVSGTGQRPGVSSPLCHAILLIDDNPEVARAAEIAFRMAGHDLERVEGAQAAYSLLAQRSFDAIVLDLNFSPGQSDGSEGLACLERIMADDPAACVVVLTAHGGVRTAVAAMQAGARDFAVKPWSNADLIAKVETAIAREPVPAAALPIPTNEDSAPARLLGESPPMERLRALIRRVGPTPAGVTVTGPEGSGRTIAARAVHAASADAGKEPVQIDLRDPEQWGRMAGADGSLILRHPDRIDELAQDRLLSMLPETCRTIAIARSLAGIGPALLRRIAVMEIPVPPLSSRGDDVVLLAEHFLRIAAERYGRPRPTLSDEAVAAIRGAEWPDEVRGLALTMERALLLAERTEIGPEAIASALPSIIAAPQAGERDHAASFDLERTEKAMIEAALREHRHNITHAASALGLSRAALYRRMERHGL